MIDKDEYFYSENIRYSIRAMEQIWYKDIGEFVSVQRLPKFYPLKGMTFTESLNAIMRFAIYFTIILFAVKRSILTFYIIIFFALLTFFMYEMYVGNKRAKKELFDKMNLRLDQKSRKLCIKPTQQNPFMNPLMNEYKDFPDRPEACSLSNSNVRNEAETFFENSLFKDIDDVWSRKSSSRNWHTVPGSTIPNDRKSFTDYLYNIGPTCKEGNGNQCFRNLYNNFRL